MIDPSNIDDCGYFYSKVGPDGAPILGVAFRYPFTENGILHGGHVDWDRPLCSTPRGHVGSLKYAVEDIGEQEWSVKRVYVCQAVCIECATIVRATQAAVWLGRL